MNLQELRQHIRDAQRLPQAQCLARGMSGSHIDAYQRSRFSRHAVELIKAIRAHGEPSMMESFLAEYGLSSEEGVALMCLAEALLRVPDAMTMDALIEDKIAPSQWGEHLGRSSSSLINASTWALLITGRILTEGSGDSVADVLQRVIRRLGEPVIRQAVTRIMKELGDQFVLGETMGSATRRAAGQEQRGYTYSYDMLGEGALSGNDARRYHQAYADAIEQLAVLSRGDDLRANPGISIKLSALHPRYETINRQRVMQELVPAVLALAHQARTARIGLNIDAEEADRLDLSLDVIEAVARDPGLADWAGLGVVVQAYGQRAAPLLDWLYALAQQLDRKMMVRLVKGAYWDSEIKHAQVLGLAGYPVFVDKYATDVNYVLCAEKLLGMTDRIYPQFATHNAHTVAALLTMASDPGVFEFQRLHGMGETLYNTVLQNHQVRCRIYAPVGAHRDLLAYLVRRLLENGANSSFVNQLVDENIAPEDIAADPFARALAAGQDDAQQGPAPLIVPPPDLYLPQRRNSAGWDLSAPPVLEALHARLQQQGGRYVTGSYGSGPRVDVLNPASGAMVGTVQFVSAAEAAAACETVVPWDAPAAERAAVLCRAADLYQEHAEALFSLLMREAGKTLADAVGELREAVDFLRYYAAELREREARDAQQPAAGVFACISPWNFPLAIFTGQISAALAAGNGVVAKPAESTVLVAGLAVSLLKQAGVPEQVLSFVPGTGSEIGAAITAHPGISGVCFTGSTRTAQAIHKVMAAHLEPGAPLIAETGGINAMIVDSTALPEQAIKDVLASAFQSAGQRCSALRILFVQEEVADEFISRLQDAMDELRVGDPADFSTDVGPVISAAARDDITAYIRRAAAQGRLLKQLAAPAEGWFVGPALIAVDGMQALTSEVFGPVLHVARYAAAELDARVDDINASGFGLTFGLHTRIDDRVQKVVDRLRVGNMYVNRNQIGAVVGSQPFGGEAMSGTGPKAGGPRYLPRFWLQPQVRIAAPAGGREVRTGEVETAFAALPEAAPAALEELEMPGPTGESNRTRVVPRGRVLCLGPTAEAADDQCRRAAALGCLALAVAPGSRHGINGSLVTGALLQIQRLEAAVYWGEDAAELRKVLSGRSGPIVPLLTMQDFERWLVLERHVCIDTTAAGGNASLMA